MKKVTMLVGLLSLMVFVGTPQSSDATPNKAISHCVIQDTHPYDFTAFAYVDVRQHTCTTFCSACPVCNPTQVATADNISAYQDFYADNDRQKFFIYKPYHSQSKYFTAFNSNVNRWSVQTNEYNHRDWRS